MNLESERRYLCTMKGSTLFVHGVASVYELTKRVFPYVWTYAFTESYLQYLIDGNKFNVVWYQKEFDFDS